MLSALEEAKEREDYGLYLSVGNEMIGYYRSVSQFQKAYRISEDMLLLMEELQMVDLFRPPVKLQRRLKLTVKTVRSSRI